MIKRFADWDESTFDLAIERFTEGIDTRSAARLAASANESDLCEFEAVVAAIHLAELSAVEPAPAALLATLEAEGRLHVSAIRRNAESTKSPSGSLLTWAGWLVAASLALIFFLREPNVPGDPSSRRETLVASADDLVNLEWSATEDPAAVGATGNVVWSSERQEGYMLFTGLEVNDPSVAQYQLWIFDPTRAEWEAKPVDGGVFDVSGEGAVVVPIEAKLNVRETALFAVTVEVPGGVVVSERERIVLTAAL